MADRPLSHLRWQGAAALPAAVRDVLLGPGAPFELVTEPVLGHDHVVFALFRRNSPKKIFTRNAPRHRVGKRVVKHRLHCSLLFGKRGHDRN